ncbi:MAG: biotin--[acetyl-CoA-carboxylase] ligase [Nannocystaceae bacterium]|nr:biotin--[acetyl-CoA-carboxylase] ligase [Nannocystaceae bacterium]
MTQASRDDLRTLGDSLATRVFGRAHEHHDTLASTNDRAAAWLREGGPHGLVVTADAQSAGRGRNGRVWSSPPGHNLYVSLGLRVASARRDLSAVGLVVGLALFEGLGSVPGLGLKWPNDLLIGERKLAGILCESRWGTDVELVIGFGINVRGAGIDPTLDDIAVALDEVGVHEGRVALLAGLLAALQGRLDGFLILGFDGMRQAYERANLQIGTRVRVSSGADVFEGMALGVEDSGALRVQTDAGERVVHAADVTCAR